MYGVVTHNMNGKGILQIQKEVSILSKIERIFRSISQRNWDTEFVRSYLFRRENKTGVIRNLVILQDRHMFSRIDGELSPRSFKLHCWKQAYLLK